MGRKTAIEQADVHIRRFFEEAKEGLLADVMKTRQIDRRAGLLAQIDAFDKVEARYYHWITSQVDAA